MTTVVVVVEDEKEVKADQLHNNTNRHKLVDDAGVGICPATFWR